MESAFNLTPGIPPPYGQSSDFVHPVSLSKWNVVCVTVCLSLTTTAFVLRTYARLGVMKQWILEDYMCCVSYVGLVIYCTLMTITFKNHGGIHEWDLTLPEVSNVIYWSNTATIEYAPIILCTKLTVLLLYRRVFLPHRGSTFDMILRAFMIIIGLYYTTTVIAKIWECTPRARIWDKSVEGKCIDMASLLNTDGVFNTMSDMVILIVPVKVVWRLQMKTKRKVGVFLLFTVGLIAPVFSIIGWAARLRHSFDHDVTYDQPEILLWAAAELSTGVICICLPVIPALLRNGRGRPSKMALPRNSDPRHLGTFRRKQPASLSDQDPINREYLDLGEDASRSVPHGVRLEALPDAVVSDIDVGAPSRDLQDIAPAELEVTQDGSLPDPAMMKTEAVEQSRM